MEIGYCPSASHRMISCQPLHLQLNGWCLFGSFQLNPFYLYMNKDDNPGRVWMAINREKKYPFNTHTVMIQVIAGGGDELDF